MVGAGNAGSVVHAQTTQHGVERVNGGATAFRFRLHRIGNIGGATTFWHCPAAAACVHRAHRVGGFKGTHHVTTRHVSSRRGAKAFTLTLRRIGIIDGGGGASTFGRCH